MRPTAEHDGRIGAPTEQKVERRKRPVRTCAAVVAAAGFACMAGFEIALALGAPFGRAAWAVRARISNRDYGS